MDLIAVLDLLDGIVVRGVAGRREEYRPVRSCLTAETEPLAVARAFRERLGLDRLYVADLDAILADRPNVPIYRRLIADGFQILVDAGLRDMSGADDVRAAGAAALVAGLETIDGPQALGQLCEHYGPERVIFSLDLRDGTPLGNPAQWQTSDPAEIAQQAVAAGIERMIVLDLAGVGVGCGVPTIELCRRLRERFPQLELIAGGGVRRADDVRALNAAGINSVLLASALHSGAIGAEDVRRLRDSGEW